MIPIDRIEWIEQRDMHTAVGESLLQSSLGLFYVVPNGNSQLDAGMKFSFLNRTERSRTERHCKQQAATGAACQPPARSGQLHGGTCSD